MLNDYLEKCAVIGAGGKMGSGIALLLLQEMARLEVEQTGRIAGSGRLILIDMNDEILTGLQAYLRKTRLSGGKLAIRSGVLSCTFLGTL